MKNKKEPNNCHKKEEEEAKLTENLIMRSLKDRKDVLMLLKKVGNNA